MQNLVSFTTLSPASDLISPADAWRRAAAPEGPMPVGAGAVPELAPHRPSIAPEPAIPPASGSWLLSRRRGAAAVRRWLDAVPALLTWLIVLSPLWAGYFLPLPFALGVLGFDLYWLYLSTGSALRARASLKRVEEDTAEDWHKRYRAARVFHRTYLDWSAVRHVVIVPTYREPDAILVRTLESLAAQTDPWQIHVILAMEAREQGAREKAERLIAPYQGRFGGLHVSLHPAGIEGEVAGKSANEAWAARWARRELLEQQGWDLNATTVTSCDADTIFHPSYFACLTYKFATDEHRYRRFWQSAILLTNNIWQAPAPLRVASSLAGVHILSNLVKRNKMMFPQSTYSLSFRMADDVGYWDVDVIPEDWHMFLKCFFSFRGEVEVEPIFLPTGNDAVECSSYVGSLKMAYIQHRRHAWGSSDVPYALAQSAAHPEIGLRRKTRRLVALAGNHLIWATHWFILSLGWIMPHVVARLFGHTSTPLWLPAGARILLWLCLVPYVSMFFIDRRLRPAKPAGWSAWRTGIDVLWWALLPVTSFIFSTVPALDAQTRLALGKRLEYRVTAKKG
ncbi:MAG: glycosyltransferase family 2 protein [Dehalococcoidia bacterium]